MELLDVALKFLDELPGSLRSGHADMDLLVPFSLHPTIDSDLTERFFSGSAQVSAKGDDLVNPVPNARCLLAVSLLALPAACGSGVGPASPSSPTAQPSVQPAPPAQILNGQYEIRFEADASCTNLPDAARVRRYMTRIDESSSVLTLTGAQFGPPDNGYSWNYLYPPVIHADGTGGLFFQDPEVWELLTADSYVTIFGTADGVFDPAHTELIAHGDFTFCSSREKDESYPECAVPAIVCHSDHHTVTLTRQ